MAINIGSTLLDMLVLAVTDSEETYGYKITTEVKTAFEISESTLYPVLRRLLKDSLLESYDMEYQGRNRRYYKITNKGKAQLRVYYEDWKAYKNNIDRILVTQKFEA